MELFKFVYWQVSASFRIKLERLAGFLWMTGKQLSLFEFDENFSLLDLLAHFGVDLLDLEIEEEPIRHFGIVV